MYQKINTVQNDIQTNSNQFLSQLSLAKRVQTKTLTGLYRETLTHEEKLLEIQTPKGAQMVNNRS